MPPPTQREWFVLRTLSAVLILGLSEALGGLFGSALQRSPSNFGCFFVIFTIPLGVRAGVVLAAIAKEKSNRTFAFLLAIVTVSCAALTLLYISTRQ